MTGAGSGQLLLAHEQTFKGSLVDSDNSGSPDWYQVGRDPTLPDGPTISRNLQRLNSGQSVESEESVAQNVNGSVTIDAVVSEDVHKEIEQFVFNDNGVQFQTGRPNTARIFVSSDYLGGNQDRVLFGCIPQDYSVSYEQGGLVSYSLQVGYAEERTDQSLPLTDITPVTDGSSAIFHGFDLQYDGISVAKLQSAELSISNIADWHYDGEPIPDDAVIRKPETSLDFTAIVTSQTPDRTEVQYGAANADTIQDTMASVAAEFAIGVAGSNLSTYQLSAVKPDSTSWANTIASDDTTESVSCHVNGVGVA